MKYSEARGAMWTVTEQEGFSVAGQPPTFQQVLGWGMGGGGIGEDPCMVMSKWTGLNMSRGVPVYCGEGAPPSEKSWIRHWIQISSFVKKISLWSLTRKWRLIIVLQSETYWILKLVSTDFT